MPGFCRRPARLPWRDGFRRALPVTTGGAPLGRRLAVAIAASTAAAPGGTQSPVRLPRQRASVGGPLRRIAAVAFGLVVLAACTGPAVLEPSTIGVVAKVERLSGVVLRVTLDGGRSVEINTSGGANLEGGAEPREGTLLLLGETEDGVWFDVLAPDSDPPVTPCWTAAWYAKKVDGAIQFDNGLRLPTAPDFDGSLGTADGRFRNPTHRFCVNDRGVVTAYR